LHLASAEQAARFREHGFTMFSSTFESAVLVSGLANVARDLKRS
jgi:hypothetical protein